MQSPSLDGLFYCTHFFALYNENITIKNSTMNKALPYFYLTGAMLMPTAYALAHGGEDDGHVDAVPVADPSGRIYVMIGVGVVFALMIGWFVWSKIKSKAPMGDTTPTPPPSTPVV
jgi:hypothetical protein